MSAQTTAPARSSSPAHPTGRVGRSRLRLTATDAAGGSARRQVTVTVTPVNDPPEIGEIDDVTFPENGTGTLSLAGLVSDPDNNPASARLAITGGTNVQATIAGNVATFRAAEYWNGAETLTLSATDPSGETGSRRFVVRITPVNYPADAVRHPGDTGSRGRDRARGPFALRERSGQRSAHLDRAVEQPPTERADYREHADRLRRSQLVRAGNDHRHGPRSFG